MEKQPGGAPPSPEKPLTPPRLNPSSVWFMLLLGILCVYLVGFTVSDSAKL